MASMKVKHYPLTQAARIIILLAAVLDLIAMLYIAYVYPTLPQTIPTHYGPNGAPTTYGSKSVLLIAPVIVLIISFLFLVIMRFRYTMLEKYPYLLNLPSFVYRLGMEKNQNVQGQILSQVFTVYSIVLLYLAILNLVITTALFQQSYRTLSWMLPAILLTVAVFAITVLALYRKIYHSFASKS